METIDEEFSMKLPEMNDTLNNIQDMQVAQQGDSKVRSTEVEFIPPTSPQAISKLDSGSLEAKL